MTGETEEALIRAELSRSWMMRSERRRLEKRLAEIEGAQPAEVAAPQPQSTAEASGPGIEGNAAFIRATKKALGLLKATPSWNLGQQLRGIRQTSGLPPSIGGYVKDGVFHAGEGSWNADAKLYASIIAHEGAHVAGGHTVTSTENEQAAFRAQAQALRELGAHWTTVAAYDRMAENPTHHIGWTGPDRRDT